ncbi:MAG: hypothetical protein RL607_2538 [Bacteroidota bacterium]|jgi:hypothetical protein
MFQSIQKKLLLKHPVLWNLRVIPSLFILVILNILAFLIGYASDYIDFSEHENNYRYENSISFIFLAIAVSLLLLIFGLVQYFKNNAFKAFYPVKARALYKEWLIMFALLFGLSLVIPVFFYGKEVKIRSYYSEAELKKRCAILSEASFFVEGSYSYNNEINTAYTEIDTSAAVVALDTVVETGEITTDPTKDCNCFYLRGKKYSNGSLLNKNIDSYSFFDQPTDSLRRLKIQNWLIDKQKDSILKMMNAYLGIAKEHHLKANITAEQWYTLLVQNLEFETSNAVGRKEDDGAYIQGDYNLNTRFDSINKHLVVVDNETREYYKHYVPQAFLDYNYDRMVDAYVSPDINFTTLLIPLYIALGLSLLIFSFRVTSGKQWLIALVVVIIYNILAGIFTALISNDYSYVGAMLFLLFASYYYFIRTTRRKQSKKISGIMVNILLWVTPSFWVIIYYITLEVLNDINYSYHLQYEHTPYYPAISFLRDHLVNINYFNILFVIVLMSFYTQTIRKWRGVAEE